MPSREEKVQRRVNAWWPPGTLRSGRRIEDALRNSGEPEADTLYEPEAAG